jgi:hypothetical protein
MSGGIVVVHQRDRHHALGLDVALALAQQRVAADEARLVPGDGEASPPPGRVLLADVVAPVAIGLLDPAVVHRVHAGGAQAEVGAGFHQVSKTWAANSAGM